MSKLLTGALALGLAATAACTTIEDGGDDGMSTSASAQSSMSSRNSTVGGAEMFANKNIVENAMQSPIHTTLVQAVVAAGLVDTLKSAGPFTVFAPTNDAFNRLPAGTVSTLMQPANKAALARVLTYHVVPGKKSSTQIAADIRAGGGTATYPTAQGGSLRIMMEGANVVITDSNGNKSYVTQADVNQSNGVIHVVNGVLLPAQG